MSKERPKSRTALNGHLPTSQLAAFAARKTDIHTLLYSISEHKSSLSKRLKVPMPCECA